MNWKQKRCLWIGMVFVALAVAFFLYYTADLRTHTFVVSVHEHKLTSVELFVLLTSVIVATTAAVLVTFKDKKPKDE